MCERIKTGVNIFFKCVARTLSRHNQQLALMLIYCRYKSTVAKLFRLT
jgi:hypothetical protein